MRAIFIAAGVTALLNRFDWVNYIFGAIILYPASSCCSKRRTIRIRPRTSSLVSRKEHLRLTDDFSGG